MSGFKCPECKNHLKQGSYSCMCGWRSKPKEPEKPKYQCRKCDHTKYLFRCGSDKDSFYLCDTHLNELKENLEEKRIERAAIQAEPKRDYLQDKADGIIK